MTPPFPVPPFTDAIRMALAPQGSLRAGINLSNTLLVSGHTDDGRPDGVSPDMARAIAAALDVPCTLVPYPTPGAVADAVAEHAWDIALIGAEPQRAETIAFTQAYAEIEACFAVREGSPFHSNAEIDQASVRIVTTARAAFTLWLERHIKQAKIIPAESLDKARDAFLAGEADALASLKSKILDDHLPHTRIIEPGFMTVQQAVGCARAQSPLVIEWLSLCVRNACARGFVARRIEERKIAGLKAAAPA